MNCGLNAVLYAINGGQIVGGDLEGKTSRIMTSGDTGNGVIAIGGGALVGDKTAPYPTSAVYVLSLIHICRMVLMISMLFGLKCRSVISAL